MASFSSQETDRFGVDRNFTGVLAGSATTENPIIEKHSVTEFKGSWDRESAMGSQTSLSESTGTPTVQDIQQSTPHNTSQISSPSKRSREWPNPEPDNWKWIALQKDDEAKKERAEVERLRIMVEEKQRNVDELKKDLKSSTNKVKFLEDRVEQLSDELTATKRYQPYGNASDSLSVKLPRKFSGHNT